MSADGTPLDQPMLLMYDSRDRRHHTFAARISALARQILRLALTHFYSMASGDAVGVLPGRGAAHHAPQAWIDSDARFYLCGSAGLFNEARRELIARGVPRFAIFSESFDTAGAVMAEPLPGAAPHGVHFVRSKRKAEWLPGDRSLLSMAERLGIDLGGGCRVVQCEGCRITLRSGHVGYLAEVEPQREGDCLACVAVPLTDLRIDA